MEGFAHLKALELLHEAESAVIRAMLYAKAMGGTVDEKQTRALALDNIRRRITKVRVREMAG